jgi:hypothetical protein
MSEQLDHVDPGSGGPPGKQEPSGRRGKARLVLRFACLIAVVALIGAHFWLRGPNPPIDDAPGKSRWATEGDPESGVPWVPLSPEDVRTIAIEEVRKRDGWLGTAGDVSREGRRYYVRVARGKSERSVEVYGPTRTVTRYLDMRNLPWNSPTKP